MSDATIRPGTRVLLLEDDALINMSTADLLREFGCDVQAFMHLEDGLEAASASDFDVAVLDVNIRGRASYPVAERLHARGIPLIFVTGYETPAMEGPWRNHPSCLKPCRGEDLRKILTKALSSRSQ